MKHSTIRGVLLVALLSTGMLTGVGNARGQVIFDNLFNPSQGFSQLSESVWQAQRFNTVASNVQLTSATLTLYSGGGSGTFFLRLFSDAAGQPGTALATLFSGADPFPGPFPQEGDITFGGLNQPLLPNTNYWMVLGENAGPAMDIRWGATSISSGMGSGFQPISAATPNQGGGWTVFNGAPNKMQLTVSPIPEPMSMLLGLVGSGGLLLVRRARRFRGE